MKITQKQSSSSSQPSDYVKNMEKISRLAGFDHQNAIVFSTLIGEIKALEKKLSYYHSRIKKLEKSVDCIENYIEERTGLEPGKELTDSSESSSAEEVYTIEEKSKESSDDEADEEWYKGLAEFHKTPYKKE
jgi:hypothetical protein